MKITASPTPRNAPAFCTPTIKDHVKLLPGYMTPDWTLLQANFKETYCQHDKPEDTHEALIHLVKEAPTMDLNVYVIKFTVITDSLIAKHALSDLNHVGCLLDGLQPELRSHVLKFCTKKSWRLSSHDTGTQEPNFDELKEFVITEAKAAQKQTVYNSERAIREGNDLESHRTTSVSAPTPVPSTGVTPVDPPAAPTSTNTSPIISATPSIISDPIAELTNQLSQLMLSIQGNMQSPKATYTGTTPSNGLPNRIS